MNKVSIIVPNYNHAQYLQQRLESIFNQTYKDFEVILLDDCSTDNSVEILNEYAKHPKVSHFVKNKINSGSPFIQWKRGLDLAKYDYVWIAESDDWADNTFLANLVPFLEEGFGVVYCRSITVNNQSISDKDYFWADGLDPTRWKADFQNDGIEEIKKYLIYRTTIPNVSSCLLNKKYIVFPDTLLKMKFSGDWYFWIRTLENCRIRYYSQRLNYHRFHSQAIRMVKSKHQELQRFKERFININYARKICKLGRIRISELKNYNWLIQEYYYKRKVLGWFAYFPAFPLIFLFPYYGIIFKHLVQKIKYRIFKIFNKTYDISLHSYF